MTYFHTKYYSLHQTLPQMSICATPQYSFATKKSFKNSIQFNMLIFEKWGINFLDVLLKGKRWIIMTLSKITKKNVMNFVHDEIFVNCESPWELLLNNERHFLERVVALYFKKLKIKDWIITFYHSHMNEIVKSFNDTLNFMFKKILDEQVHLIVKWIFDASFVCHLNKSSCFTLKKLILFIAIVVFWKWQCIKIFKFINNLKIENKWKKKLIIFHAFLNEHL